MSKALLLRDAWDWCLTEKKKRKNKNKINWINNWYEFDMIRDVYPLNSTQSGNPILFVVHINCVARKKIK